MEETAQLSIHLIASGQTAWQEQGRLQGDADLPLTGAGRDELVRLIAESTLPPVRLIHCGPDEASRSTAELFAATTDAKVKPTAALAEMKLGLWQGLRAGELIERYPTAYRQWTTEPASVAAPEGETLQHANQRVQACALRLIERTEDEAVVLVLRPIVLGLCTLWLGDGAPADWRPAADLPAVQRFDVDTARIGARRSRRRRARSRSIAT